MTRSLTADEHDSIANAIRAAEAHTSGEIYCVVARSSDSYFFPAAFIVGAGMVAASLLAALGLEYFWFAIRLPVFVAAQLCATGAALLGLWLLPSLRIHFVPHGLRYRRAHANAQGQFLARNVHVTAARTGVLIFVSLAEHYAAVVADSGIDAKVGQKEWDGIVGELTKQAAADRLAQGFVGAISAVGALLAVHFPVEERDINELDDHLVEL
ncbi:TPM domain-containing protein [Corticibacterium sp. UT-5YL-CI-8]|nr:TPM domain-containing protein [Tianweitania sp. UT-5YL-CI-8]